MNRVYRPCVGLAVFSPEGRLWLGQRAGTPPPHNWQMPQGGVDAGEDVEAAAWRELAEETGITHDHAEMLDRIEGELTYDLPEDIRSRRGWKVMGQRQTWFAFRLHDESCIDLDAQTKPEFDAWRWGNLAEAVELIVPFKREVYEQVEERFRQWETVGTNPVGSELEASLGARKTRLL